MMIWEKVKRIWIILNAHYRRNSVAWLRSCGAIVGENVQLYGHFTCSPVDATCLKIGSNVKLVGTHILTHDASPQLFVGRNCVRFGRVEIGDNVFVGLNSIILPNVKIGSNVIIGAGSVVTRDIPDGSVAVGNPARVIETIDTFLEKTQAKLRDSECVTDIRRTGMTDSQRFALNERLKKGCVYYLREESR